MQEEVFSSRKLLFCIKFINSYKISRHCGSCRSFDINKIGSRIQAGSQLLLTSSKNFEFTDKIYYILHRWVTGKVYVRPNLQLTIDFFCSSTFGIGSSHSAGSPIVKIFMTRQVSYTIRTVLPVRFQGCVTLNSLMALILTYEPKCDFQCKNLA